MDVMRPLRITCIYHSADFDGKCSAAIVKKKYPHAKLIGMDYKDTLDESLLINVEELIVVDFSLPPDQMERLNQQCDLVWIDHHKTAIEANKHLDLNGLQRVGDGACQLCWEFFFPDRNLPLSVGLLSKYDVWANGTNNWEGSILPFQWGIRTTSFPPERMEWWNPLLEDFYTDEMVKRGRSILLYYRSHAKEYLEQFGLEGEIDGHKFIAANIGRGNSQFFESAYNPDKHDMMVAFLMVPGGKWQVSLYSDKIDVSVIAKAHGGGGHKGAAGFVSEVLPLSFKEK